MRTTMYRELSARGFELDREGEKKSAVYSVQRMLTEELKCTTKVEARKVGTIKN